MGSDLVVVASPDPVQREGLRWLLEAADRHVLLAAAMSEVPALLECGAVGCVLVAVTACPGGGRATAASLRAQGVPHPIVALLGACTPRDAVQLVRGGLFDVLPAASAPTEVVEAVSEALAADRAARPARVEALTLREALARLTPRERSVAACLAAGLSGKEAAARLGISPHTVEVHRTRVLQKTGCETLLDLAVRIARSGTVLEVSEGT